MSMEAMSYVYRHSPYTGANFIIHLSIADSVNDQHNNTFWMSIAKLADKSRVARKTATAAVVALVNDGYLILEQMRVGGTNMYRFVFIDRPVVFESRSNNPRYSYPQPATPGITPRYLTLHPPLPQVAPPATPGSTNPIEPKKKPNKPSPKSYDLEFETFWKEYPRKEGKGICKKKFTHIAQTVDTETIIAAAHIYALKRKKEDPRYTALPLTWLNQGRYLDEDQTPEPTPEPTNRYETPEICPHCETSSGWIYDEKGLANPCPKCR